MRRLSLPTDKEQLRATLVIGLIAAIIAMEALVPKEMSSISIIFGILVTYWFLYAIFTAYGISETKNVRWSNRLRSLGELSFHFPVLVLTGVIWVILMEKFGFLRVPQWNYLLVWFSVVVLYAAPKHIYDKLTHWKEFTDRVKSNWKDYVRDWVLFFGMSSPLLVLQYYRYVF
jgi:hypothetical protein